MEQFHGTTIVSARRGSRVALGGDGQVTLGNIVVKASARKVRRLYQDKILAGFAGGTADAFTLFERFEAKLEKHQGNLLRSAVELAKDWRSDRILRRLEAMLVVCDPQSSLIISGNGDVVEPEQGLVAIGSGGPYAQAAARALLENTALLPEEIVKKALTIAGVGDRVKKNFGAHIVAAVQQADAFLPLLRSGDKLLVDFVLDTSAIVKARRGSGQSAARSPCQQCCAGRLRGGAGLHQPLAKCLPATLCAWCRWQPQRHSRRPPSASCRMALGMTRMTNGLTVRQ